LPVHAIALTALINLYLMRYIPAHSAKITGCIGAHPPNPTQTQVQHR